jgi:hypothetical protein
MADSIVNSLAGPLVDEICAAVGSQQCDFKRADQLMAQLAEIRVADTACGSGGFLIKVLRAFWRQYQRIDAACAWVVDLSRPKDDELNLAAMPPNVENALRFRRRWNLDSKRKLMLAIAQNHVRNMISNPTTRNVLTLMFCRAIMPLCVEDLHFRKLTGTERAFPDFGKVFDGAVSIGICRNRGRHPSFARCRKHDKTLAL